MKMSPIVRVLIIAGVLDIIVWALILAADQTRSTIGKVVEWEDELYCKYGKDGYTATICGVSAMVFLLGSHLLTMLASRCLCFTKGYVGSRFYPILLFISSWVTFLIAEICLLEGSIMNAIHHPMDTVDNPEHVRELLKESSSLFCETLIMEWVFTVAAISTGLTYAFSALYYFFNINTGYDTGVPMTNV